MFQPTQFIQANGLNGIPSNRASTTKETTFIQKKEPQEGSSNSEAPTNSTPTTSTSVIRTKGETTKTTTTISKSLPMKLDNLDRNGISDLLQSSEVNIALLKNNNSKQYINRQ